MKGEVWVCGGGGDGGLGVWSVLDWLIYLSKWNWSEEADPTKWENRREFNREISLMESSWTIFLLLYWHTYLDIRYFFPFSIFLGGWGATSTLTTMFWQNGPLNLFTTVFEHNIIIYLVGLFIISAWVCVFFRFSDAESWVFMGTMEALAMLNTCQSTTESFQLIAK